MTAMFTLLAQTHDQQPQKLLFGARDWFEVVGWFIVIVIGLILACIFTYRLYARLTGKTNEAEEETAPFTLADLRRLHREGQMTDDEFEAAKAQIVGAYQKQADRIESTDDDDAEDDWGEWVPIDGDDGDDRGDGESNDADRLDSPDEPDQPDLDDDRDKPG